LVPEGEFPARDGAPDRARVVAHLVSAVELALLLTARHAAVARIPIAGEVGRRGSRRGFPGRPRLRALNRVSRQGKLLNAQSSQECRCDSRLHLVSLWFTG